jgi:hypothetical protein
MAQPIVAANCGCALVCFFCAVDPERLHPTLSGMRLIRILFATLLLAVGVGGGVILVRSSQALGIMLVQGRRVVYRYRDSILILPGRPVAAVMMGIPPLACVSGAWLLLSPFWRDDNQNA